MTDKEKLAIGVTASVVVHLLLLLLMVVWSIALPEEVAENPEPRDEATLELVLDPQLAQRLQAVPAPTPERRVLDTSGLNETAEAPENARFESDKNSRAASESAASGNAPAPSQAGRERDFPRFENTAAADGPVDTPPAIASLPEVAAPATPPPAEPGRPTPAPPLMPRPTPALAEATPPPEPVATPEPTPPETDIPGVVARPTPRAVAAATPAPTPDPREEAMLRPVQPRPPSAPGYQAQSEQTKIEGNISNRGKAGVDAVSTPLGRYQKTLAAAIGSRWNYYVRRNMDLIQVGTVQVRFYVTREGRTTNVLVRDSTSNTAFESFCVESITAAEIPPIPPEVVPLLEQNRLEIDYTFTIYPN